MQKMDSINKDYVPALLDIGFNNLEAEIYITLLREAELTGYRIAKILGKPVANTYKALESLKNKGAVLQEMNASRKFYMAVPISDYLNLIEEQFRLKRKSAEAQLKDLKQLSVEKGIYKLQTVDRVYERCKSMIEKAKDVILADIFPIPMGYLKDALVIAATDNGVETHVKAYKTLELKNCNVINSFNAEELLALWQEQWIVIAVDLAECLIASISGDGKSVEYAIWTRNPYITFIVYNGAMNEMISFTMQNLLADNKPPEYIQNYVQKYKRVTELANKAPEVNLFHN